MNVFSDVQREPGNFFTNFKVRELWFHGRSRLADMCINLHTVYKCHRHSLSLVIRLIFLNYMKPRVFVLHALYYK